MVSDAYGSQDEEEDTNERNRRRSFLRTAGAIALAPARGVGRSIKIALIETLHMEDGRELLEEEQLEWQGLLEELPSQEQLE